MNPAAGQTGPRRRTPPFPMKQMTILALCRICEPIAFMSIFPYIYFMVKDFHITDNDAQIFMYCGMVTSAFAFAEFSSGVAWGRLSDKIGRKPVLLTGLAGTALSMLIFGFSPNLPTALLARALGGLLNGNIGVLQTTVAEMITVKEHQPRAYTIMPFVWCLGSILGPSLGGALARPVVNWPETFQPGSIWERFPYLLPNLVCTVVVTCGVVVGILFLEETHSEKKYRRDPGLEAGKWIISKFARCAESKASRCEKLAEADEILSLLNDESEDQPPGYRTTQGSPALPSTAAAQDLQEPLDLNDTFVMPTRAKPAATKAFTKQVVINIIGYGILAYHTMTFDSMLPTMLSFQQEKDAPPFPPPELPFKFVGTYGMSSSDVGVVLSVQGLYSMIATIFLFPIVVRRLGALGLFRTMAISYPILYIVTPYLVLLPENLKMIGLYAVVIWKCTFSTMTYPSNAILLTNSAPSLLMLGTINGVAASTASISRAFGPTISGFLLSTGASLGYSGLAWWCSAAIAMIGAIISLNMTDKGGRMDVDEKSDEEQEQAFDDQMLDHCAPDSGIAAGAERRQSVVDEMMM